MGVEALGNGQILGISFFSLSVDIASVAAGAALNTDVTVPGVAVGDTIVAVPPVTLEAGIVPQTSVAQAADTVRLRVFNSTAAAVDPAAATWTFIIYDRTAQ